MKRAFVILTLIGAAAFVAMKVFYPSTTIRFKLSVEAEIKGTSATGETVIAVTYAQATRLLGASSSTIATVEGEALHMELGGGRLLLMLLTPGLRVQSDPEIIVPALFKLTPGDLASHAVPPERMPRGSRLLPIDLVPVMAVLEDRSKPSTVRFVDTPQMPVQVDDAVKLKSVRLDILEDGVPGLRSFGFTGTQPGTSIEAVLPWLRDQRSQIEFFNTLKLTGYRAVSSIGIIRMFQRS